MGARIRDMEIPTTNVGTTRTLNHTTGAPIGSPQVQTVSIVATDWYCSDVVSDSSPYPDHDLVLKKGAGGTIIVDGRTHWIGNYDKSYESFPVFFASGSNVALFSTGLEPWDSLKNRALANANPNVPEVDLPLFLWELKDLPKMIRQIGQIVLGLTRRKDVPGYYLGYQFGIKPLISDLGKLVEIGKLIDRRQAYIKKLRRGHRVRRQLGEKSHPEYVVFQSGTWGSASCRFQPTSKAWFTLRMDAPPAVGFGPNRWEAVSATLGLSVSAATLWNMIPWSWLHDWFANFSTYLDASRGGIPFRATRLNLMQSSSAKTSTTQSPKPGISLQTPALKGTAKYRKHYNLPTPTLPDFRLPPFDGYQLSILAALWSQFSFNRR